MDDFAVEVLKKLGLTDYQARVVYALLRLKEADVRRISEYSGVPRTKAYEVLKELRKMGFVVEISTKPVRYAIADPDSLVDRLYERKKIEVDQLAREVESLKHLLPALSEEKHTAENYIIRASSPRDFIRLVEKHLREPTLVGYTKESRGLLSKIGTRSFPSPIDFILTPDELFIPLNPLGQPQREYIVVVFTNPYVMEMVRRWTEDVLLKD